MIPGYLAKQESLFRDAPRKAALEWFREARYGLFMHYGLYSLIGRHEWVQLREKIPVGEMEKVADDFRAEQFEPEKIADWALDCGFRYINLTTRHHDGFCLFESAQTDFHSLASPCKRDLVAELAVACRDRSLGLFLYYSHGRDWRHPHAPNNDRWGGKARPEYDLPEPRYAYGADHDLNLYLEFMKAQVRELLTQYGPVAGIWLDGIAVPLNPKEEAGNPIVGFDPRQDGDAFRCQELYDLVHELQPQALVSYKQGYLHTEDFYAPERNAVPTEGKPGEICETMMPESWGHDARFDGQHKSPHQVWEKLENAARRDCNLLMNSGPIGNGSLHAEDVPVLSAVGQRIRDEGLPSRSCA